jgi:hypothetical protein
VFAKQLRSEVDIDSDADHVWQVLTNLAGYAEWNPFMTRPPGPRPLGSD